MGTTLAAQTASVVFLWLVLDFHHFELSEVTSKCWFKASDPAAMHESIVLVPWQLYQNVRCWPIGMRKLNSTRDLLEDLLNFIKRETCG